MKTYRNISNIEQLDLAPGEEGERTLTDAEEARMVERGAIEVVETETPEPAADGAESATTDNDVTKTTTDTGDAADKGGEKTPEQIAEAEKAEADKKAAEEAAAKAEQKKQERAAASQAGRK